MFCVMFKGYKFVNIAYVRFPYGTRVLLHDNNNYSYA